jgi:glutathione S-transferase
VEVTADIERVVEIWNAHGGSPRLFGAFCGADIMFAPIATRFQTYDVRLDGHAKDYMDRLLEHPLVAEWLYLGKEERDVISALELS